MKRNLLVAAALAALVFAGAATAHGLLRTIKLNPGACHRISRHFRVCAKRKRPHTLTVVNTVTAPPVTVTTPAVTVTAPPVTVTTTTTDTATVTAPAPPQPSPLSIAVEQVRREVAYETQNSLPYSDGRLVSQAAMEYVAGHVSASAYGYLTVWGLPLPSATPDSILAVQAGICGHAALTFAAIVKALGYPVRSVQFYYTDPDGPAGPGTADSHIADEVYYDAAWHYFDPTFGNYFEDNGNVLSITDAQSLGHEVKDLSSFTNLAEDYFYGNGTAFETDPATEIVLDGQPFA